MSLRRACAAVASLGLAVAAYLTIAHYAGSAPVCAIAHGCATVQKSAYAQLGGIPVALLGLVGYAAILLTLLRDGPDARTATAALAYAGTAFSGWLTYVEIERLEAICVWCVTSAVCMTVAAILATARVVTIGRWPRPSASTRSISR